MRRRDGACDRNRAGQMHTGKRGTGGNKLVTIAFGNYVEMQLR